MYNPMEVSRIDKQIEDLQRLKASYQTMPQPINNFITTPSQPSQPIFEAKFTNENPADIYVSNKTAFIDLKNGKLSIKEVDGDIKEYCLIMPKDEKDLKIENLERKLRDMENKINNYSTNTVDTINNTTNTYNIPQPEQIEHIIDENEMQQSNLNPVTTTNVTTNKFKMRR